MTDEHDAEPTQLTQPKGIDPKTGEPYEPIEIPVPKRDEIEGLLSRATRSKKNPEPKTAQDIYGETWSDRS